MAFWRILWPNGTNEPACMFVQKNFVKKNVAPSHATSWCVRYLKWQKIWKSGRLQKWLPEWNSTKTFGGDDRATSACLCRLRRLEAAPKQIPYTYVYALDLNWLHLRVCESAIAQLPAYFKCRLAMLWWHLRRHVAPKLIDSNSNTLHLTCRGKSFVYFDVVAFILLCYLSISIFTFGLIYCLFRLFNTHSELLPK